jgi:ribosomal protein S18 acetylase RimI-like enzyme
MTELSRDHELVASEIHIDGAIPQDARGIVNVQKEGWLATYPNEQFGVTQEDILSRNLDSDEKVATWEQRLMSQGEGSRTWVAKDGDKVVGFCSATKDDDANHLRAIYVMPQYQGRSIGSQLMEQALQWLGDSRDVVLEVVSYNEKAISFYEKLGFQKGESLPDDSATFPSGASMPEIQMRLPARTTEE